MFQKEPISLGMPATPPPFLSGGLNSGSLGVKSCNKGRWGACSQGKPAGSSSVFFI